MTLLELLVKELPGRGGWPEGANFIACDEDGYVDSYEFTPVLGLSGIDWICSGGGGYLHHKVVPECACSDWDSSIITRDQYEAALAAAQPPVWNGEGLPPIGSKVESFINGEWKLVKVVYVGEPGGEYEALVFDVKTTNPTWSDLFRPIHTKAERKRDKAIDALIKADPSATTCMINAIYNAIAAGKIPGVEISK